MGVDALWQREPFELMGEFAFAQPVHGPGQEWGLYLQGVRELVPRLYLVGRYEHFDQPAPPTAVNLFDLGLAWKPWPYVVVKGEYLFAIIFDDEEPPGVKFSLAVLFEHAPPRHTCVSRDEPVVVVGHVGLSRSLAVIVHPTRTTALSRENVARIYLRKRQFWDDGAPIIALNRESGTEARDAFTRRVLPIGKAQLHAYWNEQYFHGIFPPPVLSSAGAVKRYVAAEPNAIGYIETSEVDESVRVVLRLD